MHRLVHGGVLIVLLFWSKTARHLVSILSSGTPWARVRQRAPSSTGGRGGWRGQGAGRPVIFARRVLGHSFE
jgi:hypothetical protein